MKRNGTNLHASMRIMQETHPKMTDTWRLDVLPTDVLFIIFDYCDEYDLLRLSEVCKRFYEIVCTDVAWTKRSKRFLVTNQTSERFRERCFIILRPHSMWPVSYKWQYGIYKNETVITWKTRMMPWLKITNNTLWFCSRNELFGLGRTAGNIMDGMFNNYFYTKASYKGGDICKFVLWKDYIICGHMDGTINYFLRWCHRCPTRKTLLNNQSCVNAIDASSENVIAGLDCGKIKIQRHPNMDTREKNVYDKNEICISLMDKVRSLSIDPTGVKFAVGSTGITCIPPLHVIDIERYTMVDTMQHTWKHGAGILDMVWDDPNTLLTCGYDTYIRKWDLRTGRCVCSWADPTDATLYCISSDHQYTMVTGTQYNCLAVLWDQRKSDFVQLYYVHSQASSRCSPIYSVQFDSTYLYCATDKHVFELDFLARSYQKFDYKSIYNPRRLLGSCRMKRFIREVSV